MTETWEGRRAAWRHSPALLKERIITGALHSNASNDHVSFDCVRGMINKLEELLRSLKRPPGKKGTSPFSVALFFKVITYNIFKKSNQCFQERMVLYFLIYQR